MVENNETDLPVDIVASGGAKKPSNATYRSGKRKKMLSKIHIDYRDVNALKQYLSSTGRIVSSRISGLKKTEQHNMAVAIKRAREIGLLPYTICDSE